MTFSLTLFAPLVFASIAFTSTGLGGMMAFKLRDRRHLLLGFSAGAVIAVALFDLLPEVFALDGGSSHMALAAVGFLAFFGLERYMAVRRAHEHRHATAYKVELGALTAGGLCLHSFLDGVAIGVGFQASAKLGLLIALGIITHDISDGLNTVTVVLAHGNLRQRALFWLTMDMLAPILGAATTLLVNLDGLLPWVLALFVGSFLYIGASDLLPEAKEHQSPLVGVATATGMLAVFLTTHMLHGDWL